MDIEYYIIIAKNRKQHHIKISFTDDGFYHLIGLQHLKDISFGTKNKSRIFKNVINKKICLNHIQKSKYFSKSFISERISLIHRIEYLLDNSQIFFKIIKSEYMKYTNIKADYLCSFVMDKNEDKRMYLFLKRIDEATIEYRCCSLFKEHNIDYQRGTTKTTVLLVEKQWKSGDSNCMYKHPRFEYIK